jgi:predicted GIY-YIG superfamily endonuclease
MTVYLVHLDQRLGSDHPNGGARHYLGQTQNLAQRLESHRAGLGARILAAANERGIAYDVVRTWPGGRDEERRLKRQHNAPKLCPTCAGGSR